VSVRLSVTRRYCIKTAKHRIAQVTPHDSAGTLVSDAKDLREIQTGSHPTGAQNVGVVGENRRLTTHYNLKTV